MKKDTDQYVYQVLIMECYGLMSVLTQKIKK